MRAVIQRVTSGAIAIDKKERGRIGQGFVILLGIAPSDTDADIDWLVKKISALRVFDDAEGKMNLSIQDITGEILLVSQFTLFASSKKGNRPSFNFAADPSIAIPLYEKMISALEKALGKPIQTGVFGANMQIEIHNDGPVTILLDSKVRE
ncbi:D-tyrosyl-tRNA(Tyr) deacylase [Treponema phagedenis]|uniref:D-aminoacyl-tRNA deacylase n=1 Tax=Treponema phagedenis TaxID=162 RepID=A0A0B7GTI7_TREPH|nr:D-aminoacyl-tRNA deacylase [Treponema phagedenis]NVP24531.1 D-tyrosyl-tRNA(Tyr) deacylase [Treponema phagedenis]QEJ94774.1 D-tyrosyl-tRNA(Tyr) deacylase [Treponema phagedenis]QEJ97710.1 D-tyrosyl-tRNA(Tyr) deacylase [Treponema phagedenis]QEK00680.1 D-tyrosyl-tRNA(Tyr) deacylase [Treponema phagedenis]QEK03277.1 D-tyrosyl-tRNA(Tyr) deacylase [Treponema phagedenis]